MQKIAFIFAKSKGFAGQTAASEFLAAHLPQKGWGTVRFPTPALERTGKRELGKLLRYAADCTWQYLRGLLWSRRISHVHLNLGQTLIAAVRDGGVLLALRAFHRPRTVISLHGSLFMSWKSDDRMARVLRFFVRRAAAITVLGPHQQAQLQALGIPLEKIVFAPNTVDLPLVDEAVLLRKHAADAQPLRVLFLSSLIEAKGYPVFLEALQLLARQPDLLPLEATLCGPLYQSAFGSRFRNIDEARTWILGVKQALAIPGSRVRLEVVWGASGTAKTALFDAAQVFVFPTSYAVEAQPLVLLEAMARGCAIITSPAGEIPSTVADAARVVSATASAVAETLRQLLLDSDARLALTRRAHALFAERYAPEAHLALWHNLFAGDDTN